MLVEVYSDINNAKFIFKSILDSMQTGIEKLDSPIEAAAPNAKFFLNNKQILAVEKSFSNRKNNVQKLSRQLYSDLSVIQNFEQLNKFLSKYQMFRDQYFATERVADFYTDIINTRIRGHDMGRLLQGCDRLALESLKPLCKLRYEIPPLLSYSEYGRGASIIRSKLILWDGKTNPTAVIKVIHSAITSLKLLSICHEAGHSIGAITNANSEFAEVIYQTVLSETKNKKLSELFQEWHTEIFADMIGNSLANYGSLMSLVETVSGSPARIFFVPTVHPISFLRVHLNAAFCRIAFGRGPWDDLTKMWNQIYPPHLAKDHSKKIVEQSLPILPKLCKTLMYSKMNSFNNMSLAELIPFEKTSPEQVRKILNKDLSNFSENWSPNKVSPILSLLALRVIQMHGKQNRVWIQQQIIELLKTI